MGDKHKYKTHKLDDFEVCRRDLARTGKQKTNMGYALAIVGALLVAAVPLTYVLTINSIPERVVPYGTIRLSVRSDFSVSINKSNVLVDVGNQSYFLSEVVLFGYDFNSTWYDTIKSESIENETAFYDYLGEAGSNNTYGFLGDGIIRFVNFEGLNDDLSNTSIDGESIVSIVMPVYIPMRIFLLVLDEDETELVYGDLGIGIVYADFIEFIYRSPDSLVVEAGEILDIEIVSCVYNADYDRIDSIDLVIDGEDMELHYTVV